MNRTVFYLAALLLHLAVLFLTRLPQNKTTSPSEAKYLEVSLQLEPAPKLDQPRPSTDTPNPRSGSSDKADTSTSFGPPTADTPPPVAIISEEVSPPPPSPVPISPDSPPSSTPPTMDSSIPDAPPLPVGPPTPNTNPPPTTSNGKKPSSAPVSGFGGGNAQQWSRGGGGNGHYYVAVYVPEGISWNDAQKYALIHGGYLATITSAEENDFVFKLINDPKFWQTISGNHNVGPWIGGYKTPNGRWHWVNNEGEIKYTNWLPTQPDNHYGGQTRIHFLAPTAPSRLPKWDDLDEGDLLPGLVVEYDSNPAKLPLNPAAAASYIDPAR